MIFLLSFFVCPLILRYWEVDRGRNQVIRNSAPLLGFHTGRIRVKRISITHHTLPRSNIQATLFSSRRDNFNFFFQVKITSPRRRCQLMAHITMYIPVRRLASVLTRSKAHAADEPGANSKPHCGRWAGGSRDLLLLLFLLLPAAVQHKITSHCICPERRSTAR